MEEEPARSASGAGRVLDLLVNYFRKPSMEGFSAYRTGWIAHVAFSIFVAAGIVAGALALGATQLPALILATVCVVLLWGVGVLAGVYSHYIPFGSLAAFGAVFALMFYEPTAKYVVFGTLVAGAVHAVIAPVLIFVLRQLRKLFL
jgi:hypothetical protein